MAEDTPEEEALPPSPFTDRQQRFIEEYAAGRNCTQAAKLAGYSPDTAYSQGSRLLKNVEIRAAIDERLASLAMGAAEVTKGISEIAETRLNDFFTIRPVQGYELEEHYLSVLKERAREEVEFIQEFASREGINLVTVDGLTPMGKRLAAAQERLLEMELEIMAHGPDAVKLVPGKPAIKYVAELDLVKLAQAKEGGRIKSYSMGKDGIKVETYAADAAQDRLARMHGLYEKDNKQLQPQKVTRRIGGKSPVAPTDGTGA